MKIPAKFDLHMHSVVSDGTDTPSEIVSLIKKGGYDCFSITDHDAMMGCQEAADLVGNDVSFISGVEFSVKDEHGKYHMLGYGYDINSKSVKKLVGKAHGYRTMKFLDKVSFLQDEFGIHLPEDRIDELLKLNNPGSPHLGQLMVEYGYAKSIPDAIENYIKKKKFNYGNLNPPEVIDAILSGGGIPVLAHPVYGNGSQNIHGDELEERVKRLVGLGIQGLEGYYSKYDDASREEVLGLADKYGLYVTAGSDYHGSMKKVVLGNTGFKDPEKAPEGMHRFFEDVKAVNETN